MWHPPTVPDRPRQLAQVRGSPSDPARRSSTDQIRMACKRSGVRIPLAPQVTDKIRKPGHQVQQESTAVATGRDAKQVFGSGPICRRFTAGKVGGWRVFGAVPLPADQDKCFSWGHVTTWR
jgi:hypothetical protein